MTIRKSVLGASLLIPTMAVAAYGASGCSSDGAGGKKQGAGTDGGTGAASNGGSSTGTGGATGSGGSSMGGRRGRGAGGANNTGGAATGASGGAPSDGGATGTGGASTGSTTAADVAAKIGKDHFLIGMGNDLANNHDMDGAYTLGVTLDVHYAYLTGIEGYGGWPEWNQGGTFVNILTDSAKKHGVIPMMTLYAMAAKGEANTAVLTDDSYMGAYWKDAKLMYQRLGVFGGPAMVQFEPDWWAYAQHASADPSKLPVHVTSLAPDCSSLPDTMVGMGKCLVLLGRKYAPMAILGFHASTFADPDPAKVASFLVQIGAGEADFVTTDMLDRDAGCFEAHTDPNCQRNDGPWYWDETNQTSPNFHDNLAWVKKITDAIGKPMLWWQVPFGVPSTTKGGTAGHYRDNRVHYIFAHIDEFVAAGGLGAVFGTGAGNQTYIDSDGDQFKKAATGYFASPVKLP